MSCNLQEVKRAPALRGRPLEMPTCTCQDPDFLRFATLCVEYRAPDFVLRAVTSTVGAFIEKIHVAPRAQPGLQMPPEPRWPVSVHGPPRPPSTWGSVPPVAPTRLCSACFSAATLRVLCHREGLVLWKLPCPSPQLQSRGAAYPCSADSWSLMEWPAQDLEPSEWLTHSPSHLEALSSPRKEMLQAVTFHSRDNAIQVLNVFKLLSISSPFIAKQKHYTRKSMKLKDHSQ